MYVIVFVRSSGQYFTSFNKKIIQSVTGKQSKLTIME